MALVEGLPRQEIQEAVDRWRDQCLLEDGSLLFDGQQVWTPDNLARLYHNVIEAPLVDRRTFMEKFREQLEGNRGLVLLGAEALTVYYLFVWLGAVTPTTKRARVNDVLSWAGEELADPWDIPQDPAVLPDWPGYGVYTPGPEDQSPSDNPPEPYVPAPDSGWRRRSPVRPVMIAALLLAIFAAGSGAALLPSGTIHLSPATAREPLRPAVPARSPPWGTPATADRLPSRSPRRLPRRRPSASCPATGK